MTIVEELQAMEGWAIEARDSYSTNRELTSQNLGNIYNQAKRMRAVPKTIYKNLASIQAAIKNIRNEEDVTENFAILIETIQESIDFAQQVAEGKILEGRVLAGRTLKGRVLKGRKLRGRKLGK